MSSLNPIKTAQHAKGFSSFGATARALLQAHPDNDWGMQPRSLETQLGKLDKGVTTWWINHIEVAQALGALLDLSLPDLGLHDSPSTTNFAFNFPGFPGLKPLDLRREEPWAIGNEQVNEKPEDQRYGRPTLDEWLRPEPTQWRAPYEHHWLYIADALERRLLTHHLLATSRYRVVVSPTLEDASDQLRDPKPLILVVEGNVTEEDFKALGLRHRSAGLLVIAPVPVRQVTTKLDAYIESMSWERLSLPNEQRRLFDRATPCPLQHWTWTLQPEWRPTLLKWVEKRLNWQRADTLFDAQSMGHWLEQFDPLGQWFETPSDLMQLCAVAHSQPITKLPKPNDAEAGKKLTQLLFTDKTSRHSAQLQQWAVTRWSRLELAWRGPLLADDWLTLVPPSQLPPSAEEVHAIASARTAPERQKAADRVVALLKTGNPGALHGNELLTEGPVGQFAFAHPTWVRLIVRDKLMRQIAEETSSWGLACFDADRRDQVDAALDAVPMETLMQAVQTLTHDMADNATSAAALGASEALFVAIGRRISNREVIHDTLKPALMHLAEAVIGRLDLDLAAFSLPAPWTRPLESPSQQLAWIGACWAWSLLVTVPDKLVDKSPPKWLFPGWSESLPPAPDWLDSLWPEKGVEQLSRSWKDFFKVADELVKDWDQPVENAPRILRLALLGRAAHGAWPADTTWWEDLITLEDRWTEEVLLQSFRSAGKGSAARLWSSYLEFEMGAQERKSNLFAFYQRSSVRLWLLSQLSPAEALVDLTPAALGHLASFPQSLPPEFRAPLLLARSQSISFQSFVDTGPDIASFGKSASPVLPELLTHEWLGVAAAEFLWTWDAATAERLFRDEATGLPARENLLHTFPADKLAVAIEVLNESPALFSLLERCSWARSRLPSAGKNAPELINLLRSCPIDSGGLETEH